MIEMMRVRKVSIPLRAGLEASWCSEESPEELMARLTVWINDATFWLPICAAPCYGICLFVDRFWLELERAVCVLTAIVEMFCIDRMEEGNRESIM